MMASKEKTASSFCCCGVGHERGYSNVRPLVGGRILRIVAGGVTVWIALHFGVDQLSMWGFVGLMFLGVSFVVSGVTAMPGCEIAAIPNLFIPRDRRRYLFCPVWTPVDKAEHGLKDRGAPK